MVFIGIFYSQEYWVKHQIIELYLFDLDWQFVTMDTLIKSARFIYLVMSIYLINKYREQLKDLRSNIENIDLVYNTLPEHTNTTELKTSIIKTKFSRDKKDTIQSKKESIPSKDEMAERSKTSIKSRFSICK